MRYPVCEFSFLRSLRSAAMYRNSSSGSSSTGQSLLNSSRSSTGVTCCCSTSSSRETLSQNGLAFVFSDNGFIGQSSLSRFHHVDRWPGLQRSKSSRFSAWHDPASLAAALTLRQLPEQIHHFDRRQGRLEALVARLGSSPVDGLLQGVTGQDTEDDWNACGQRRLGHPLGRRPGHIIIVVRIAANDRTETDNSGILAARGQALCDQRYLERAGYPDDVDPVLADAMTLQSIQ